MAELSIKNEGTIVLTDEEKKNLENILNYFVAEDDYNYRGFFINRLNKDWQLVGTRSWTGSFVKPPPKVIPKDTGGEGEHEFFHQGPGSWTSKGAVVYTEGKNQIVLAFDQAREKVYGSIKTSYPIDWDIIEEKLQASTTSIHGERGEDGELKWLAVARQSHTALAVWKV